MKKQTIYDLIRYYADGNDPGFRSTAYAVAQEFLQNGNEVLAHRIHVLLAGQGTVTTKGQETEPHDFSDAFEEISLTDTQLHLPEVIYNDVEGIAGVIRGYLAANKFLFQGASGTGKTESAKHLARLSGRKLYAVDFNALIDSHPGQSAKNIQAVFEELNGIRDPEQYLFLIEGLDSVVLGRNNQQEACQMGRVTSAFLKEMDKLSPRVTLIAATNLFSHFDKALLRRFDAVVDFNRYEEKDLLDIAEKILSECLIRFERKGGQARLFRKIMRLASPLPMPGDQKNLIRSAVLFDSGNEGYGYLQRLYRAVAKTPGDISDLLEHGFTLREIESLTGVSKSKISRDVKKTGDR